MDRIWDLNRWEWGLRGKREGRNAAQISGGMSGCAFYLGGCAQARGQVPAGRRR